MSRSHALLSHSSGRQPLPKIWRGRTESRQHQREQVGRQPSFAGLSPTVWQAGNAAMSRLLDPQGNGRSLEPSTLAEMEQRFGEDFAGVRIHEAPRAAAALKSRAFVQGEAIYLGADAPSLEASEGKSLVAHELAHVVQQRQAVSVDKQGVSQPDDRFEQAADRAAQQAMQGESVTATVAGTPPGIQCDGELRPNRVSREQIQTELTAFLDRALQGQGGKDTVRITPEVQSVIERILLEAGLSPVAINLLLNDVLLPKKPATLAAAIAKKLPSAMDRKVLERLEQASGAPATPGLVDRATDLVEKSTAAKPTFSKHPSEVPRAAEQAQQNAERTNEMIEKNRDPAAPKPPPERRVETPLIDVTQLGRIFRGAPAVLKPPSTPAPDLSSRDDANLEQAIQKISPDALIPAKLRGTKLAESLSNAQDVARELARLMDAAHRKKQSTVELRLSEGYRQVEDKGDAYDAMAQIVTAVRNALSHRASNVETVKVYFGSPLPRVYR